MNRGKIKWVLLSGLILLSAWIVVDRNKSKKNARDTMNKELVGKLRYMDTSLCYSSKAYSLTVRLCSFGQFGYRMTALVKDSNDGASVYTFTLPYPIYHFELADVKGEGKADICLGVIKPTRFDSAMNRRLFLYKVDDGRIRPLWLGSRVSHPLVDFRYVKEDSNPFIRTIEKENNGNYLVAQYKWEGFGLAIVKYISRNINKNTAYEIFHQS